MATTAAVPSSTSNTQFVLTKYGTSADIKKVTDKPVPEAKKGEVVVQMKTIGINFADNMFKAGMYTKKPSCPVVMGMEGAGVVSSVGEGVTSLAKGDPVICCGSEVWQQFKVADPNTLVPVPSGMSLEDAAALTVNYVTAYHILFDYGNLRPGKTVLIHMAAGGVGCAAIQLCKTVDNVTMIGTASAGKHAFLKELGVTHCIDYRTQDWETEVKKIAPKGVDIVFDPLGGPDSKKAFNCLAPLGKVIHYGWAGAMAGASHASYLSLLKQWWETPSHSNIKLMTSNKSVCGYHMGLLPLDTIREALTALAKLYESGEVKPIIDSVYPIDQFAEAFERMASRKNVGKIVLSFDEKEPRIFEHIKKE